MTTKPSCRRNKKPRMTDSPPARNIVRMLYTRTEAAFQLSISVRSLDYAIEANRIKVRRLGGRVLVPHSELLRFASADSDTPLVVSKAA